MRNETNGLRVIVLGASALFIVGMGLMTAVAVLVPDSAAIVAALGGTVATGAAGIFGLWKLNEGMQGKMDENAKRTDSAIDGVAHRLNGDLDRRMREAAREAVLEALREWTEPRPR